MIQKKDHTLMGRSRLGWLDSHFHFSFADYYNKDNMDFGVLRVINDDLIQAGTGFDMHPHEDMEIITYVVDGHLTHKDSMGNKRAISKGHVQYMSAGTGVYHSEHNLGDQTLRLLQIWIRPDQTGHVPDYGDYLPDWEKRENTWFEIVSSAKSQNAPVLIHQDVSIQVSWLESGNSLTYEMKHDRQAYLVQIEGESIVNDINLQMRDGIEAEGESLKINAKKDSHFLLIEMNRE